MQDYLTIEECKHGHLYKINSRNLKWGVFNASVKGFIGIREKFGRRYLFTEFHWDTGPPFGTVKPIVENGEFFGEIDEKNSCIFEWLDNFK